MSNQNNGAYIHNKLYQFTKSLYSAVHNMPKEYKYDIGQDMLHLAWQCLDDVFEANACPDSEKNAPIRRLSLDFDKLKLRLRMAQEIGIITIGQYAHWQETWLIETGNMTGGWLKWSATIAKKEKDVQLPENLSSLSGLQGEQAQDRECAEF